MSIEINIDYDALAQYLAPLLIKHLETNKNKNEGCQEIDLPSGMWSRVHLKKFFGDCSNTTISGILSSQGFPSPVEIDVHGRTRKMWCKGIPFNRFNCA